VLSGITACPCNALSAPVETYNSFKLTSVTGLNAMFTLNWNGANFSTTGGSWSLTGYTDASCMVGGAVVDGGSFTIIAACGGEGQWIVSVNATSTIVSFPNPLIFSPIPGGIGAAIALTDCPPTNGYLGGAGATATVS
jgi:hypothetical protein